MRCDHLLMIAVSAFLVGCNNSKPHGAPPAENAVSEPSLDDISRTVNLFGEQVVPRVSTTATARGVVRIEDSSTSVDVRFAGLEDVTSVHLHNGRAGTNGPVVLELLPDPDNAARWFLVDFHDETLRDALSANLLYIDVHTAGFADGEVRGQVAGDYPPPRFVSLSAADTVPPSASGNSGVAAITTADFLGSFPVITAHVHLQQPGPVDAVTINYGAVGQNGPVLHSLTQDRNVPSHWLLSGAVLEEPDGESGFQGFYLLVRTPNFPDGEIRGQIETRNSWFYEPGGWWDEEDDELFVTSVSPWDGATTASLPATIVVDFNHELEGTSIDRGSLSLQASGGDGSFSDGNEFVLEPDSVEFAGNRIVIELDGVPWQDDVYRLTVFSGIRDRDGHVLLDNFISAFAVDQLRLPPASFADIQNEIFTPSCAQMGCHSGAAPASRLDLSAGVAHENIVNVQSREDSTLDLIEPNDPLTSYLLEKLLQNACCEPHPEGLPDLGNTKTQMLWEWVLNGAPMD